MTICITFSHQSSHLNGNFNRSNRKDPSKYSRFLSHLPGKMTGNPYMSASSDFTAQIYFFSEKSLGLNYETTSKTCGSDPIF